MIPDPILEPARLRALRETGLVASGVDARFDRLSRLAARLVEAPVAMVSLVDAEGIYLKSQVGLSDPLASRSRVPLECGLCPEVVRQGRAWAVEDARADPTLKGHPSVTGLGVVAYLGVPLAAADGQVLGVFSVVDFRPRAWTAEHIEILRELATSVMAEVSLDAEKRELERARARLAVQHATAVALAELPGFETGIGRLLEVIGGGLQLEAGQYWVPDASGGRLRRHPQTWTATDLASDFGAATQAIAVARGEGLAGRVWDERAPAWVEDLAAPEPDDSALSRRAVAHGLRGAVALPILGGADLLGVMVFFARRPLDADAETGRLLATLGQQIGQFAERRRAELLLSDRDARLRSFVETAADGIIVLDDRGRIEAFNPAAERLFGYQASEVLGSNMHRFIPPELRAQHDSAIGRFLRTRSSQVIGREVELTALRRDGARFPIQLALSVMEFEGKVTFTGIVRDLSSRRRVEADLRSTNALLQTIDQIHLSFMSQTPAPELFRNMLGAILGLCECDAGLIAEVSAEPGQPVAFRTLACHGEQPRPEASDAAATGGCRGLCEQLQGLVARVSQSGQQLRWEHLDAATASPPPWPVPALRNLLGLPLYHGEHLVGVIGLANRAAGFDDALLRRLEPLISSSASIIDAYQNERRRAQAEVDLQAAKEAAEAASRSKSEFLANMSHEVRTPVAAVLGYAEILLEPDLPRAEADRAVEAIRSNGTHLLRVLEDILDLSKVEAGKMHTEPIPCSIWELAGEVLAALRVRADERRITLARRALSDLPASVRLDPTRVRQVLINLVSNALKFSSTGGRVEVRLAANPGATPAAAELIVEVKDDGIGMSREQLNLIFLPFQQADNSTTRRFGGTGLGLSISQRLVDLMGGTITVRSEIGQGSCFRMVLPVWLADETAGTPGETAPRPWLAPDQLSASNPAVARPRSTPEPMPLVGRVLLVEDSVEIQRVVQYFLTRMGVQVETATNGLEAIAAVRGDAFDAILMDMQMPELDGYGATEALRRDGYTRPIIALTAHSLSDDREKCLRAGCDDYLSKPVSVRLLNETLARYLSP